MSEARLTADLRSETGKRPAGRYRREGKVPAVVYGLGSDAQSVTVPERELTHILTGEAGANTLITLKVDGADQLALAREIQRHPVKGSLVHVDFVRVRADQTITAEVPLRLLGQPEGASQGGMLEQLMHSLTFEGLPGQLPPEIEHEVSALELGDQLHVGDLGLPAGVVVTNDPGDLVAMISVPRGLEAGEGEVAAEGEAAPEGEAAAPAAEGEAAAQE
jgi:large subunit ribosomal protein L25